jgi:hypothetical protein
MNNAPALCFCEQDGLALIRSFAGVLGAFVLLLLGSSCGHGPTEPTNYLLPTPVATDHIMSLSHTVPTTIYEGEVVTFSVTGIGLPDLGTWDRGVIDIAIPGIFDVHNGTVLESDGTISATPPQAESGGADLIISKRPFRAGDRLAVTARQSVFGNACLHSLSGCPALFRIDILAAVETGTSQKLQFIPAYITLNAGPRPAFASDRQALPRY